MTVLKKGGSGNDFLTAYEDSFMWGYEGNDTLNGSDYYDTMDGGEGNDTLYANGGDDTLIGGYGNDALYGGDGNDLVVGDNTLDRIGGDDLLNGGAGNDRLYGGYGNDLYVYAANTGIDIINDGRTAAEFPGYGGGVDTLLFTGVTLSDIHPFRFAGSNDLFLYSSSGVVGGVARHGVIIQDFYLNNQNTNIEYLQDFKGGYMSLSAMLASDDAAHGEQSPFDLVV